MAAGYTTISIRDGSGASISMRAWDETGSGPYSFVTQAIGRSTVFDVTLSLDTSAYASGDLLADTQVLTSLFRVSDGTGVLQSIQIIDQDDQKSAFDIYYLSANNTMGTENSAPSISDANATAVLGPFSITVADYKDLGGVSVAWISNIGQPISAGSGTANGYIAVVNGTGTPTYTASGIKLRLGVLLD